MEKIVLVINAHRPDISVIAFACEIARIMKTGLCGYFVENIAFTKVLTAAIEKDTEFSTMQKEAVIGVKTETVRAIKIFEGVCEKKGVKHSICFGKGDLVDQIVFESRFADLLIVDPNIGFYERVEEMPSIFLKEVLRNAECPVLIAPSKFDGVDEIIFCYDGSASALFAIKQFVYLFPELSDRKMTLLQISKHAKDDPDEAGKRTMLLLQAHYSQVTYRREQGTDDALFEYLFMQQKKIVVMGAYGRSMLSNFFRHSSADTLMQMADLPIFIAHH